MQIWNEHSVVNENKGFVSYYLHVNNPLLGHIVYELSVRTACRMPLVRGLSNAGQNKGGWRMQCFDSDY